MRIAVVLSLAAAVTLLPATNACAQSGASINKVQEREIFNGTQAQQPAGATPPSGFRRAVQRRARAGGVLRLPGRDMPAGVGFDSFSRGAGAHEGGKRITPRSTRPTSAPTTRSAARQSAAKIANPARPRCEPTQSNLSSTLKVQVAAALRRDYPRIGKHQSSDPPGWHRPFLLFAQARRFHAVSAGACWGTAMRLRPLKSHRRDHPAIQFCLSSCAWPQTPDPPPCTSPTTRERM